MINYLLILCMTLMGAVASVFFKKASSESFAKNAFEHQFVCGRFHLCCSGGIEYYCAKIYGVFKSDALTSITYIWTMVISYILLKEKVTKEKIVGVICIVAGAILISIE